MRRQRAVHALADSFSTNVRVRTRADILADFCGTTLDSALRGGVVARVGPGLYAPTTLAREVRTRVAAVSTWVGDRGVIGGQASLLCRGQRVSATGPVLLLVTPSFKRRPIPGVRLLRTTAVFRSVVTPQGRFAVTEDAIVQAWLETPDPARTGILLDLLRDTPHSHAVLSDRVAAWPQVPARKELAHLVDLHRDGVKSFLEHRARTEVFVGPPWERFERQVVLRPAARRFEIDMLARDAMLAIEFDGARFHSNDEDRRRDIERDALLATLGYTTVRLTYEDITRRPQWCRDTVRAAYVARLQALRT